VQNINTLKTRNLKSQTEKFACESFLQASNKISNIKSDFIRFGNPDLSEPDCICSNNIAIEVLGVYDNEYQAEKIWSDVTGNKPRKKFEPKLTTLRNLGDKIFEKINKLNNGNYSGHIGKIILVCHLHSPLTETRDVQNFISEHNPFKVDAYLEKCFDEIWIIWKDSDPSLQVSQLE